MVIIQNKLLIMKKLLYILTATACLLAACEKVETMAEKMVGDWHCQSTSTDAEIYVTFTAERTFTLYQQIGEGAFRVYNGTYELAGDSAEGAAYTLTGRYNDGSSWGASYELNCEDRNAFTLTAEGITETYSRVEGGIPEDVLSSCVTVVKSEDTKDWNPIL